MCLMLLRLSFFWPAPSQTNISKIYTLTNNDWMNSNVKASHCTHHSSPTQKTIPKTNESLTISLYVIAWSQVEWIHIQLLHAIFSSFFLFRCVLYFFNPFRSPFSLYTTPPSKCIRMHPAMRKNRNSTEQRRQKNGFFSLLNKLTCHIFRFVAYLCNLKLHKSRTKTLLSFCKRRENPIWTILTFSPRCDDISKYDYSLFEENCRALQFENFQSFEHVLNW